MASTRQYIVPFIMIVAWFKVPLLQKEWVPCWMWLKCDWTWLKYSWLISIRMWLLSIEIPLQSQSITINQDQSLQEFSDGVSCIEYFLSKYVRLNPRHFAYSKSILLKKRTSNTSSGTECGTVSRGKSVAKWAGDRVWQNEQGSDFLWLRGAIPSKCIYF